MKARIHCLTLAVDDIERSLAFYRDGLGLPTPSEAGAGSDHVALSLPGGLYFVLILRSEFAEFTTLADRTPAAPGTSECILSYFAADREEVDAILDRAQAVGGTRRGPAAERPWGYAGYLTDPDGHLWEIMWNAGLATEEPR